MEQGILHIHSQISKPQRKQENTVLVLQVTTPYIFSSLKISLKILITERRTKSEEHRRHGDTVHDGRMHLPRGKWRERRMLADRFHEPIRNWVVQRCMRQLVERNELAMNVAIWYRVGRWAKKGDDMTVGIVQLFSRL